MKLKLTAVSLFALTACSPLGAEQGYTDYGRTTYRPAYKKTCDFWGNCTYSYRRSYNTRSFYRRHEGFYNSHGNRDYYSSNHSDQIHCMAVVVSRVGEEKYGRDRAKDAAQAAWMEEVRNRFGVRFMDLRNAKQITYECGQSSTGNRASEKTADKLGSNVLEQCILEARPCRSKKETERD